MSTVTIYGASDDLIEIEGDLSEEFSCCSNEDDNGHLGFSDGTLVSVAYTRGFWRLHVLEHGSCIATKVEGKDVDDDYTDRLTLVGDLRWVVYGKHTARSK